LRTVVYKKNRLLEFFAKLVLLRTAYGQIIPSRLPFISKPIWRGQKISRCLPYRPDCPLRGRFIVCLRAGLQQGRGKLLQPAISALTRRKGWAMILTSFLDFATGSNIIFAAV